MSCSELLKLEGCILHELDELEDRGADDCVILTTSATEVLPLAA